MPDEIWPAKRQISVIVEPSGWFTPFAEALAHRLSDVGLHAQVLERQMEVGPGDIAFYLSCNGITPIERLALNTWNIVVHASDLPQGRGFSPLVWQILEGKNTIPVTMIAMANEVDSGDVLMQRHLKFQGHELNDEMRNDLGQMIVDMCFDMATDDTPPPACPQQGDSSWYDRRRPDDSRLDPQKSIAEQFNLLRVVDNQAYPAFFELNGQRYTLTITRQDNVDGKGQ